MSTFLKVIPYTTSKRPKKDYIQTNMDIDLLNSKKTPRQCVRAWADLEFPFGGHSGGKVKGMGCR